MPDQAPPARRPRRGGWTFGVVLVAWVLWVIGQLARDLTWLTGICFYIPSAAMTVLGLGGGLVLGVRREPRRGVALGLLTIAPAVMVLAVENQWVRPGSVRARSPARAARLVHWNIAYGRWDRGDLDASILRSGADVCVLSEVPRPYALSELATRFGPGYDSVRLGSMAFLARGRLLNPARLVNTPLLKVNCVTWQGDQGTIKIFGADVASNLLVARDPVLRRLRRLMEEHRPDLVAGDLNAPRRSRALWPLPPGFSHAYQAAGRGWSATWPVPCPLYAIDQCLLSSAVAPLRYELVSSRWSDHCMQVLDFAVESPGE